MRVNKPLEEKKAELIALQRARSLKELELQREVEAKQASQPEVSSFPDLFLSQRAMVVDSESHEITLCFRKQRCLARKNDPTLADGGILYRGEILSCIPTILLGCVSLRLRR
jgi:hypothetical protein